MKAKIKLTLDTGKIIEHEYENKWQPYSVQFGLIEAYSKINDLDDDYAGVDNIVKIEVVAE